MLADYFGGNSDDRFWIADDDDGLVGVAYCELEPIDLLQKFLLQEVGLWERGKGKRVEIHVLIGGGIISPPTLSPFPFSL